VVGGESSLMDKPITVENALIFTFGDEVIELTVAQVAAIVAWATPERCRQCGRFEEP
jgi:hypothetical protein